jgi:uncharacterized protein YkwD
MRTFLFFALPFILNSALSAAPKHTEAADKAGRAEKEAPASVVDYVLGRWVDDEFQYQTGNGEWAKPTQVKVADEKDPLTFLNAAGEKVTYEVGDVLFKVGERGWFKAKKDSPKIEDPMVPNPTKFPLTAIERGMVKATNVWRKDRKLPPLAVDPILMKTARARTNSFSHSANGMASWTEAQRNGFKGPVTDNLSSGDRSPEGSVANLASDGPSEGHYKQLTGQTKINGQWVDQKMDKIGVATSGLGGTWVHIYGRDDAKKK